jgi:hypothetical protein
MRRMWRGMSRSVRSMRKERTSRISHDRWVPAGRRCIAISGWMDHQSAGDREDDPVTACLPHMRRTS